MPHHPMRKAATLLALATLSALAVAPATAQSTVSTASDDDYAETIDASSNAEPPARVGRLAVIQGQVSVGSEVGAELSAAQINWPVTTGSMLATAANGRTEVQVGSTSIRLDGDSSLEVLQLDDYTMRLRLHHGSASIRVVNADVVQGFELETPQARIRLDQPGRLRVDAERVRDTSFVTVFDGAAQVEAGGSQLTVRAGRRAELGDIDVRTLAAVRDGFDDWAAARDRLQDNAASARYVTPEMTGYEDLDRYGSWSTSEDYGPLWTPTVASTWVPYRDGSWTWLDPWGWTWVDNAPWGYAPFHYGRWVQVRNRWAWAPGRRGPRHERPVWAPALVGWVGGAGWNVAFRDRNRHPASGWYPLTPHDRFVPSWRASAARTAWWNAHVRPDPRRPRDYRPPGLTVVPREQFGRPGRVNVPRAPIATVPPTLVHNAPAGAPPAPPNRPPRPSRPDGRPDFRPDFRPGMRPDVRPDPRPDVQVDGRPHRGRGVIETSSNDRDGVDGRDGFVGRPRPGQVAQVGGAAPAPGLVAPATPVRPQGIVSPTPHQSPQPLTITSPPPRQSPQPLPPGGPQPLNGIGPTPQQGVPEQWQNRPGWHRDTDGDGRPDRFNRGDRGDRGDRMGEPRHNRPASIQTAPPSVPVAAVSAPPQAAQPVPRFERPESRPESRPEFRPEPRPEPRPDRPHRGDFGGPARAAPPVPAPAPAPAPAARPSPPPAQAVAPAPPPRGDGGRAHTDNRGRHQQER